MDNPATSIPSAPLQPNVELTVSSSAESPAGPKNLLWLLWLLGGLAILVLGIAVGLFSAKFLNQSKPPLTPTLTPSPSTTPPQQADPTSGWEIYSGASFSYSNSIYPGYSLKYPPSCFLIEHARLQCNTNNGKVILQINAGGHGGPNGQIRIIADNLDKSYPAGVGQLTELELIKEKEIRGTFWFTKTDKLQQDPIFGFEFWSVPSQDQKEFDMLFGQILSTFKFTE